MEFCEENVESLLGAARRDHGALGSLLEYYRPFLEMKARLWMQQWRVDSATARCDPADLVQQTCADAIQGFGQFTGAGEPVFSAWILRIHQNNATSFYRYHVVAQKRSLLKEQPPVDHHPNASLTWCDFPSDGSTPSTRVIRGERALRLAQAMGRLSEEQRKAIQLRYFQVMKISAIAEAMKISELAAASHLKNALRKLRGWLDDLTR